MEYVKVIFPERREVIIDGESGGCTGVRLMIEKGTHRFELSGPKNYKPKWRQPVVKDTTFVSPMMVTFEKV